MRAPRKPYDKTIPLYPMPDGVIGDAGPDSGRFTANLHLLVSKQHRIGDTSTQKRTTLGGPRPPELTRY